MHADGVRGRPGWAVAVSARPAWPDWAVALALLLVAFGLLGGVAWTVDRLRPPVDAQPAIVLPERVPPVVRRGRGDPLEIELAAAYRHQAATVARALRTLDEGALGPFSRTEDIRLSATFERPEVGAPWKLTSSRRHR